MSETYEKIKVLSEGFSLSRIVWRRFRAPTTGVIERTLTHNPGLADLGPILPVGTEFELVIPDPNEKLKPVAVRRLWGLAQ